MKYLIFGDIHGSIENLEKLVERIEKENPDVLICTGDFDTVKVIHKFLEIKQEYEAKGKEVITVAGNHDEAILNGKIILSPTFVSMFKKEWIDYAENHKQTLVSSKLYNELKENKKARGFIEDLVNSNKQKEIFLDEAKFSKQYPTIILHGAFKGNFESYKKCPEELKILWARLKSKEDYEKNFMEMCRRGLKIMIRGHDHKPEYAFSKNIGQIKIKKPEEGSEYKLLEDRMHTITHGPLFEGYYATIDTNSRVPILKYHKV